MSLEDSSLENASQEKARKGERGRLTSRTAQVTIPEAIERVKLAHKRNLERARFG